MSKRLGETNINTEGEHMVIFNYRGIDDIDVIFQDNHIVKGETYSNFRKGDILNRKQENTKCVVGDVSFFLQKNILNISK